MYVYVYYDTMKQFIFVLYVVLACLTFSFADTRCGIVEELPENFCKDCVYDDVNIDSDTMC